MLVGLISFFSFFRLEIPDFLSEGECNHIISLAEKVGLRGSDLHLDEELDKNKEFLRGMLFSLCLRMLKL